MEKCFLKKTMIIIILLIIMSLQICYATNDLIDETKIKGYYLAPKEISPENKFIDGYGIIQDSPGYSRNIKYGLIDKNYNVIIKPDKYYLIRFDGEQENLIYAYTDPMVFFGDIFKITKDGLLKITPEPCFLESGSLQSDNKVYPLSISTYNFSQMGFITLRNKNNEFAVIDIDGNIVMPFTKSYFYKVAGSVVIRYILENVTDYGEYIVGKADILDLKGNPLIHAKYDDIVAFFENNAKSNKVLVYKVVNGDKENILNAESFIEVLDWSYKIQQSYGKYIIVKNSAGKVGVMDKDGKIVISFIYDDISSETEKLYGLKDGKKGRISLPDDEKPKIDKPTTSANLIAKLPTFDITLNGVKVQNDARLYPFIVCNDITYFPMTYYDSRFLNLKTEWDATTGLKVSKANESSGYITDTTKIEHPTTIKPTIASFDIYINNQKIDNINEPYPLLIYRDVTYFPMTWSFGVDEFGWDYKYTNEKGLQINSQN